MVVPIASHSRARPLVRGGSKDHSDCRLPISMRYQNLDLILRCLLKPREATWMLVRDTMQIGPRNNSQPGRLALKEYTVGMETLGYRSPATSASQISRRYGIIVGKDKFERVQPKLKIFRQFPILPDHAQRLRRVQRCQSIRHTWIDPVIVIHGNGTHAGWLEASPANLSPSTPVKST